MAAEQRSSRYGDVGAPDMHRLIVILSHFRIGVRWIASMPGSNVEQILKTILHKKTCIAFQSTVCTDAGRI